MASKRDRLKMLNQSSAPKVEEKKTIVDELVEQYDKEEEKSSTPIIPEPVINTTEEKEQIQTVEPGKPIVPPVEIKPQPLINVIDKSKVGRPKTLQGEYKPISARLKMENYEYARIVGGKYGGMNAYLNYLVEQDMKNNS
jgi:hypothetical protein